MDNDALRFALTALTLDTELEKVDFEIQSCPRRNRCVECGKEFEFGHRKRSVSAVRLGEAGTCGR